MSSEKARIDEVARYWNENPVHSVEFKQNTNLKEYLVYVDALRWSDNERWARKNFYEFGQGQGKIILDAGCGVGVFSRFYSRQGFKVFAIDISDKAVDITREGFKVFDLPGTVQPGSVEELPYPDNYFDYLVSNGVIHHTPDTEKSVSEFYRVLKPRGVASVAIYYRNILLRQPYFSLAKMLLRLLLKKREGREALLASDTPEDFVRAYDGNNTPIARVYTRKQADVLFCRFKIIKVEKHYFPARFVAGFKTGGILHRILDRNFGMLIYYLLQKPA